ncbi:MAG: CinA family nicotinamide mononucleotide deamidase-related protein [Chloroflexota bacterium]
MRALVLSIGSELLRGDIIDRNAAFLTRQLSRLGFEVVRVQQHADDLDDLTAAFVQGMALVGLIACTGGLGPTADDLTRQAIAGALGEDLFVDDQLLDGIRNRFAAMGRRMPESNNQQALLIPSAAALPNPNGTAPGWFVERDGRTVIAMPGPPAEMEPMWTDQVVPRLERHLVGAVAVRSVMTFGLGESTIEERIRPVIDWRADVTVATYAKMAGVEVHVTARHAQRDTAEALASQAEADVRARLGDAVFGTGGDTLASAVARSLQASGLSLAVMESATGGLLASSITDQPGSSDYFLGGIVAYTRQAKARYGVPADVMDRYGLISEETAAGMAEAARRLFDADVGLGTTGVAGSDPVEGKSPGTVFIACSRAGETQVREIHRPGDRETIKRFSAQCALDLLRRQIHPVESAVP